MTQLIYLHGKDSSPDGFRARYLREHFPQILVPALTPDVLERRAALETLIEPGAVLIGSSLGGMSALDYVGRHPGRVRAMVLLAPAVGFIDPVYRTPEITAFVDSLTIPGGMPCTVIAARGDEVIPLASIEALIARSPDPSLIDYHQVDDVHLLRSEEALQLMIAAARRYTAL